MKYDHVVKYNGVYYAAGDDVPEEGTAPPTLNGFAVEERKYTKTDINKMTTAELQSLAAENGVEGAYDKTGGELKKALIELMGL